MKGITGHVLEGEQTVVPSGRIGTRDRRYAEVLEGLSAGNGCRWSSSLMRRKAMSANAEPIALENVSREFQAGVQKIAVLKRVSLSIQRGKWSPSLALPVLKIDADEHHRLSGQAFSQGDVYINGWLLGKPTAIARRSFAAGISALSSSVII